MLLQKLHDEDSSVRREATRVLGQLSAKADVAVLSGLLDRLEDRNAAVRSGAVEALVEVGERGDFFLVSELLHRIGHRVWFVRQAAARALGHIANRGDPNVAQRLTALLTDDREEVVQSALESLVSVARPGDICIVDALLLRLDQGGSWQTMNAIANTLPQMVVIGDERVKAFLLSKLSDSREEARRVALLALPQVTDAGDHELLATLVLLLRGSDQAERNHDTRAAAASLLGRVGTQACHASSSRDVRSVLLDCAQDALENWLVRKACLESLAQVVSKGDPDIVTQILPCMSAEDHGVRQAAIRAVAMLARVGDRTSLEPLLRVAGSRDEQPFIRCVAVKALADVAPVDDRATIDVLLAQLSDANSCIRDAATEALSRVSLPEDDTVLEALLADLLKES